MPGFMKLSLTAVVATFVMVVLGVIVRSTGSGMGCPDWPLCNGQVVPSLGDNAAWLEWIHRGWGVLIGFIVLALVIAAVRGQRATRSVVVGSVLALVLTGFQAYLGKVTVETSNSGESVTAHQATAMLLLATLVFVTVRAGYPATLRRGGSQRLTLLLAFSAITVYALLLFGAHVTSIHAALVYPDWPLFGGAVVPGFSSVPAVAQLQMGQFAHRIVAGIVAIVLVAATVVVWRTIRRGRATGSPTPHGEVLLGLTGTAAALYAVQVVVGALQIWTTLAPWAVSLHLALGAVIWALLAGATFTSWYATKAVVEQGLPGPGGREVTDERSAAGSPATRRETISAYIALTKPRIVELLLVTTLPAMILAWSTVTGLDAYRFAFLAVWTLLGGSLAAGAANAINCYLDRDIDQLMARTRRRPLPAHAVAPEDALVFGLVLSVVSFALLAVTTNLVAAFLTLLAIAFYVVVYTMLLKRTTPHNIVLGGAAGALPPVIGWAAITGDITLPAVLLFAIVFYWTPPHFWALSLRIRGDYASAGVPILPVTHGVAETTRQVALYSLLMVALTLVFFAVAHMGLVFLAGAVVLGALFLFQAFAMWREGTDRRAVRLYKFSISYLTGIFALIILDVAFFVPLG